MLYLLPKMFNEYLKSGLDTVSATVKCGIQFILTSTLIQSTTGILYYSHLFNGVAWFLSCIFVLYIIYPMIESFNIKFMRKNPKLFLVIFCNWFFYPYCLCFYRR